MTERSKYSLDEVLRDTLEARKLKNANYSLRAMARDIDVSPSTLSKILNGKCMASDKMVLDIVEKIDLPTEEKERVVFFERCRKLMDFLKQESAGALQNRHHEQIMTLLTEGL